MAWVKNKVMDIVKSDYVSARKKYLKTGSDYWRGRMEGHEQTLYHAGYDKHAIWQEVNHDRD